KALVLPCLARVGRFPGQRVVAALDLEAALGRGLRRERRSADTDDGLHVAVTVVLNRIGRRKLVWPQIAIKRALPRLALDAERDGVELLGKRARGEHQPGVLLC